LVEDLLKSGAPLGGLGTQTHVPADLEPRAISRTISALARFGLPIHVSEMDVSVRGKGGLFASPADVQARQARVFGEAAEAFAALPEPQRYAFTTWGARDRDSWLRRAPNAGDGSDRPLLFDDDGQPKSALYAVARGLQSASRRTG
jgi:endo-1,4-beta-xylanase